MVRAEGQFCDNFAAVSIMEEYWFPLMAAYGFGVSAACTHKQFPRAVCSACSPLFPAFPRAARQSKTVSKLSKSEVTSVVKKWAKRLGRDPKLYSIQQYRSEEAVCRWRPRRKLIVRCDGTISDGVLTACKTFIRSTRGRTDVQLGLPCGSASCVLHRTRGRF